MKLFKVVMALLCLQLLMSVHVSKKSYAIITNNLNSNSILFDNEQVKIESNYHTYQVPNRSVIKNYLVLTVTNKLKKNISLTFYKAAYYNDKCSSCGMPESKITVNLSKREIKIGDITNNRSDLVIFHSFETNESDSKLTDLSINNVIVKNI